MRVRQYVCHLFTNDLIVASFSASFFGSVFFSFLLFLDARLD